MCTICLVNKKESTLCRLFCLQNKNINTTYFINIPVPEDKKNLTANAVVAFDISSYIPKGWMPLCAITQCTSGLWASSTICLSQNEYYFATIRNNDTNGSCVCETITVFITEIAEFAS